MLFVPIYTKLATLVGSSIDSVVSGTNHKGNVTTCSINKVSGTNEGLDTKLKRHENHVYQITTYSSTFDTLNTAVDAIEALFLNTDLSISNKTLIGLDRISSNYTEEIAGLYRNSLIYEFEVQKDFAQLSYVVSAISDETLFKVLYKVYTESSDLTSLSNGFVFFNIQHAKLARPYISIPSYTANREFFTTCSYGDDIELVFKVYADSPLAVDGLLNSIDENYTYRKFGLTNEKVLIFDWLADNVQEENLNIWSGSITYEISVEKDR